MKQVSFFILMMSVTGVSFSQVLFEEKMIHQMQNLLSINSVDVADIDSDGDMDVVSVSQFYNKISWHENDGNGKFYEQHVITTSAMWVESVYIADIDGDGDMDVLSASQNDNKIAWYKNIDGEGNFGEQQIITTSAQLASFVYASDIDGDGDIDVLSASIGDDKIAWYENIDGLGNFTVQQIISENINGASHLYTADLDNDGDLDVVASGVYYGAEIAWYKNINGQGDFEFVENVYESTNAGHTIFAEDFDGDGDLDILSASLSEEKLCWYENIDGLGNFGNQQIISNTTQNVHSISSIDIDNDGDMDIISGGKELAWYENLDSQGQFGMPNVIDVPFFNASQIRIVDMDGDNDMDILASYDDDKLIAWYENLNGYGQFSTRKIVASSIHRPLANYLLDIDMDGDLDVLTSSYLDAKISWYENLEGQGNYSEPRLIFVGLTGYYTLDVSGGDLDGDGDLDVLSKHAQEDKIVWYENIDGQGHFGVENLVINLTGYYGISSVPVYSNDIDGDGDLDILISNNGDVKLQWYENLNGQGNFGSVHDIIEFTSPVTSFYPFDADNDGDLDIVAALSSDDKVLWLENLDGLGNFSDEQILTISFDDPFSVFAFDLDNDGDNDILSASKEDNTVAWYENIGVENGFDAPVIITTSANFANKVYATDLDNDGDADVIILSENETSIQYCENIDGFGTFSSLQNITTTLGYASLLDVGDIDNDGDIDILSGATYEDKIVWFENKGLLSISEYQIQNFEIYPNPVNSILNIKSRQDFDHIRIIDLNGRIVKEQKLETSLKSYVLNLESLNSGMYFLEIESNTTTSTLKFIKQ